MKKLLLLLPVLLLLFGNCRKPEELKVTFTVRETSPSSPSYTITYTSDKSGNSNVANSTDENWSSDALLLEQGEFVSMKVESTAPQFDITLRIYVSGFLWKEAHFANPVASASLSGTL